MIGFVARNLPLGQKVHQVLWVQVHPGVLGLPRVRVDRGSLVPLGLHPVRLVREDRAPLGFRPWLGYPRVLPVQVPRAVHVVRQILGDPPDPVVLVGL